MEFVDRPDEITWRWTSNGAYTSKSAYLAQLQGAYCTFDAQSIWRAYAEGKHKFFAWLLVQTKILTADKLEARNWPCEQNCVLCDQERETAAHLCLHCPFAKQVWLLVSNWTAGSVTMPEDPSENVEEWWRRSLSSLSQSQRRSVAAVLMYTTWNLWKERNRHVFDSKSLQPHNVFSIIKAEVLLRRVACGQPAVE